MCTSHKTVDRPGPHGLGIITWDYVAGVHAGQRLLPHDPARRWRGGAGDAVAGTFRSKIQRRQRYATRRSGGFFFFLRRYQWLLLSLEQEFGYPKP